jgi:hypothetical protein
MALLGPEPSGMSCRITVHQRGRCPSPCVCLTSWRVTTFYYFRPLLDVRRMATVGMKWEGTM